MLLTTITCGIYYAWAVVKIEQFLMDNLTLDGKKFEFKGEGGEVFSLFLIQGLLTGITLGIYYAWAMVKITKYFAEKTE